MPEKVTPRLGIAVCGYNEKHHLTRCIASLRRYTAAPYELVYCDDGSRDGSWEWARAQGIRTITGPNRRPSWNRNRGLMALFGRLECDVAILLDADCEITAPGWEAVWAGAARRWGHVGFAWDVAHCYLGTGTAEDPYQTAVAAGCCSATSWEAFWQVGYLDPRFVGWGYEDVDWLQRHRRALRPGADTFLALNVGVLHHGGKGKNNTSPAQLEENRRVLAQVQGEPVYRDGWRSPAEEAALIAEVDAGLAAAQPPPEVRRDALVAPTAPAPERRWQGTVSPKPWEYPVTAVLAHWETPELLPTVLELLRLQTVRPYLMIIDTGSSGPVREELEALRAPDLEIHYLAGHGYLHSSEVVACALDVAHALCRTPYLFHTHADVFLRRRNVLEEYLDLCGPECPAVGWEMSDRSFVPGAGDTWRGMISHTATLLHMDTMHRIGATWNMQRSSAQFGMSRTDGGWPDTETGFNLVLQQHGIRPRLRGPETNGERQVTVDWDHCRSYTGGKLLSAEYFGLASGWAADALREAEHRLRRWRAEAAAGVHPSDKAGLRALHGDAARRMLQRFRDSGAEDLERWARETGHDLALRVYAMGGPGGKVTHGRSTPG